MNLNQLNGILVRPEPARGLLWRALAEVWGESMSHVVSLRGMNVDASSGAAVILFAVETAPLLY
jgi:hypothetical protein